MYHNLKVEIYLGDKVDKDFLVYSAEMTNEVRAEVAMLFHLFHATEVVYTFRYVLANGKAFVSTMEHKRKVTTP